LQKGIIVKEHHSWKPSVMTKNIRIECSVLAGQYAIKGCL